MSDEEAVEQSRYDDENALNSGAVSIEWNEKITSQLKELEPYSRVAVVVPISQ